MKAMKKILSAFLTAAMLSTCALTANAQETCYGLVSDGINNQEYQDFISKLTVSRNEERLLKLYNDSYMENGENNEAVHVYIGGSGNKTMYFEFALPDNTRIFQAGFFMGMMTSETPISATDEEMNKFLAESGLKGEAGISSDKMSVGVTFDPAEQDRTYDDVVSTRFALCEKYGLDDKNNLVFFDTVETFTDETPQETTESKPSIRENAGYDINNPEYIEYVDSLIKLPYEDKLVYLLKNEFNPVVHVYEKIPVGYEEQYNQKVKSKVDMLSTVWESEGRNYVKELSGQPNFVTYRYNARAFRTVSFPMQIMGLGFDDPDAHIPTAKEVSAFLAENGFKAEIDKTTSYTRGGDHPYTHHESYHIVYDESLSDEQKLDVMCALKQEYGFIAGGEEMVSIGKYFNGDSTDFSLVDAVRLQRYLSSNIELADSELTDFDLNGDGNLNVIDLIMMKRKLTDMNK